MWDEERVDAAIDEAARQMTAGEPGADFRGRVMARIENRPRVTPLWRPVFAGLTVAALILLAVMVRLKPDRYAYRPGPGPAPTRIVQVPPSPLGGTSEQTVRLPPSPILGYGGPRKPDTTYEMTPYEMALRAHSELDAVALPSIDLESIAVAALPAAESIHVEPLDAAAPIAVAPLNTENEGDPR